jgi:serine/threonine-protein kinase
MPTQPSVDRQTFLANLRKSGLVSEEQLAKASPRLPSSAQGEIVAIALVEMGLLTRFQADRLLAGRTSGFFVGQYRILDELGRGGMGRVYKAQHRTMQRLVALKVLAPNLLQTERAKDLFLREVRAAGQLVHPHIVTAYDANNAGGRYYLVLEYVDGPNLEQLVRQQGPLPVGLACEYVRQAALGLQHAHEARMVHRDIKPANLLVQRPGDGTPGVVKVSDFGLARLQVPGTRDPGISESNPGTIVTRENAVMGTPDYLSPEQSRDLHSTDIRSDLYSLGCTFYFLLTGRVPFPGGTVLDKLIRHNAEQPAPITKFRTDVTPPVLAVVSRLLDKNPADRFQTPAELAQALEPLARTGPTPPRPATPAPLDVEPQETPVPMFTVSASDVGPEPLDELAELSDTVEDPSGLPVAFPAVRPPLSRAIARRSAQAEKQRLRLAILVSLAITGVVLGAMLALVLLL